MRIMGFVNIACLEAQKLWVFAYVALLPNTQQSSTDMLRELL